MQIRELNLILDKKNIIHFNQQGMSILEILLASALGIGMMTAVTQVLITTHRSASGVKGELDFNTLSNTIETILNNPNTCAAMFGGRPFKLPPGTLPNPLPPSLPDAGYPIHPPISFAQLTVNTKTIVASHQQLGSNLKVTSIEFDYVSPLNLATNQYMATLTFHADKEVGAGGAIGMKNVTKSFSVILTIDPNNQNIINCSGSSSLQPVTYWQAATSSTNDVSNTNSGLVLISQSLTAQGKVSAESFSGSIDGSDVVNELKNATIPYTNVTGLSSYPFSRSNLMGQVPTAPSPDSITVNSLVVDTLVNNNPNIQLSPESIARYNFADNRILRHPINHSAVESDVECPGDTALFGITVKFNSDPSLGISYTFQLSCK